MHRDFSKHFQEDLAGELKNFQDTGPMYEKPPYLRHTQARGFADVPKLKAKSAVDHCHSRGPVCRTES